MNNKNLQVHHETITEFCIKNKIKKLSLFGSVLTDSFNPDSDIDILVEFESGKGPTLLGLARMERELSEILGRKVDLRTPQELSIYFRNKVLSTAQVQYARG